ncbi:hypothetical protein [Jiulongibacter sp. NS-SX5]|uniref:hypothetical protein n=1 Tax=Jiulongibacter sp. NS-SX5 TaxID=3463854 RepID=UPI004057EA98
MTSIRTRPRFRHVSSVNLPTLKFQLENYVNEHPDSGIVSRFYPDHCTFDISLKEHHFWSPHLNVNYDEDPEEGTILRGRYGPAPTIWTVFMFGYGAMGTALTFVSLYGLSKLALQQDATVLWSCPLLILGIMTLWIIGQTGQKLGVEQTFRIHHFLEEALGERIHIQ